ncbi:MAG: SAM-dependent methyltransferase, partial [Thermoanaerobaculia bacterium]|nr:SAM-dependent methyltransferase [Thermoanaerobaculia bacterium]
YCGVRTDLLDYTVDRSPHKQGHFLPGTRIPIHPPERVFATRPDYLLVLPWNLRDEIAAQMAGIREWGGRFVVAIPEVEVF